MQFREIVFSITFVIFIFCCAEHGWTKANKPYKNHEIVYLCVKDIGAHEGNYSVLGKIYWTLENKNDFLIKIPVDKLNGGIYRVNRPNFDIVAIDSKGHEWRMLPGVFSRGHDVFELGPGNKMTFMSYFDLSSLFYSMKGNKLSEKGFYLSMSANLILPGLEKIEIFRDVKAWPTRSADQSCPP